MKTININWTPELDHFIRGKGTAAEKAVKLSRKLNFVVTRNAVLGRLWRLKGKAVK